jgi:hypothetical protein
MTNGLHFRLQFHAQCSLFQRAHASLEATTHGSLPHQLLETTDVFYRKMRFGQ